MIEREISHALSECLNEFPVVSVTGPRQSGKSTLIKGYLQDYRYVSLENIDDREVALNDPRGFLRTYDDKVIIDEAQHAPDLFSYIQTHVDSKNKEGMYVLSGSQNFLLTERITQSLAGRVARIQLLPLSYREIKTVSDDFSTEDLMFRGGYPRLYVKDIDISRFYSSYIDAYVERDLKLLKNIANLSRFRDFLKLCASRAGSQVNLNNMASTLNISNKTVKDWLSILEESYIIYFSNAYAKRFDKQVAKSKKLYFYDTGLLCYLLKIRKPEDVFGHDYSGSIFENFIYNEELKKQLNKGKSVDLRYWQEKGNEVDMVYDTSKKTMLREIKYTRTMNTKHFRGINRFRSLAEASNSNMKLDCGVVWLGKDVLGKYRYCDWREMYG
jgi:predicted AAA+ superfamily ATPase